MQLRPRLDGPRHPFPPDNRDPGLQQQLRLLRPPFCACNTLWTEYSLVSWTTAARRRCLHGVLLSVCNCSGPKFNLHPGTATGILQHRAQGPASPYTCTRSTGERGGHRTECVLVQWRPGSEYVLLLDQGNAHRQ